MESLSERTALTPAGSGAGDSHGECYQEMRNSQQMEATGQQTFRSCLLTMTATAQKTETGDGFLHALQKQQMKLENNNGLLAELVHIERDLREKLRMQEERKQELECVRQEKNRQRWRSLCFLILNQRTAKPWVMSYYKNIPMHIYCLPIESVNHQSQKKRKRCS